MKLRIETVEELKRLMKEMGIGSIDELLSSMIRLTDAYRVNLKHCGWEIPLKEPRK